MTSPSAKDRHLIRMIISISNSVIPDGIGRTRNFVNKGGGNMFLRVALMMYLRGAYIKPFKQSLSSIRVDLIA